MSDPIGPNVVDPRVFQIQALLNLSEMATDPGMIDGRYGLRTNASVGSYINRPGNGLSADQKKAYKPNTARGQLPADVDANFVWLVQKDLLNRLEHDTSFRAAVVHNAITRLERNDPSKGPDQPDDIRSARVLGNILGLTNTGGGQYSIRGASPADDAHLLQQLRDLATKENLPVVGAPSAGSSNADELKRLQDQLAAEKARADAAELRARDAAAERDRQIALTRQFERSAAEQYAWKQTLASADFLRPENSDKALADRYCHLFVDSFCLPVINENDSPEKKAAAMRETQRIARDMELGRLVMTEDGHVIYMRMNPQATIENGKERHTVLAYDVTRYINDTVDLPGGGKQPRLNGIEAVRFVDATNAQADSALQLARAKGNLDGKPIDTRVGIMLSMQGDRDNRRDVHYSLQIQDENNDGHADRLRIVSNHEKETNAGRYERAIAQTHEAIRMDMTQRGPRENMGLNRFNDVTTYIEVDPRLSSQKAVDDAAGGPCAAVPVTTPDVPAGTPSAAQESGSSGGGPRARPTAGARPNQ